VAPAAAAAAAPHIQASDALPHVEFYLKLAWAGGPCYSQGNAIMALAAAAAAAGQQWRAQTEQQQQQQQQDSSG
jgi:hypothetical protein